MKILKLVCPHCDQHLEIRADEESFDINCPGCSRAFNPLAVRQQRAEAAAKEFAARPAVILPPTLSQQLDILRVNTAYASLRSTINVLFALSVLGSVFLGFSRMIDSRGDAGFFIMIAGILVSYLFLKAAMVVLDIADAVVSISRREK